MVEWLIAFLTLTKMPHLLFRLEIFSNIVVFSPLPQVSRCLVCFLYDS